MVITNGARRLTRSKRSHCPGSKGTHKSKRSKRGCGKPGHKRLRSKRCHHWGSKRHHMGQRGGQGCIYRDRQRGGNGCTQQVGGTGCHCNGTGKPHSHNKRFSKVSGFSFGSSGGYKKRNMGPAPRIQ